MTLVYVYWFDSAYARDTGSVKTFGPIRLHTVGWLVREDDECVVIAMESDGEGEWRDLMAIPHMNVIDRRDVEYTLSVA